MRARILIVDDDPDIVLALENRVTWMGHEPLTANNGKDGLRLIEQAQPDLVLLDLELPLLSGMDLLQQVKTTSDRERSWDEESAGAGGYATPLIVMLTAFGTIERAVQAMQLGAFDFVPKPFTADHLTVVIRKALDSLAVHRHVDTLTKEVDARYDAIVGDNVKMATQLTLAKQAAASNVTVLLLGETGTGKEVVARAIHRWSPRKTKPFVPVNCAAIPKDLLENELFGHEKGAFTGAVKREAGKIEIAEGGTVFLDEIGDMSLQLQSHLLRVLQDQTFYRVGGTQAVHTDVRFIAATNKDLKQAIRDGTFREDLYYRLAVIAITLPPLRERMDDVPALARHFLGQSTKLGISRRFTLTEPALRMLLQYQWPGNIRELQNVLTHAMILCPREAIAPEHLHMSHAPVPPPDGASPESLCGPYHDQVRALSRKVIEDALRRNGWNQTKTAQDLSLQRTYLTKLLRQMQIPGKLPKDRGFPSNA
jgi:DNA-binding NtrC family response regulator